uniref:Uncharacterized protein n=1 Tax=Aegilops tauschii subsp. strangulata TaxID=200361 RepID=A0A453KIZ7_AEGTS
STIRSCRVDGSYPFGFYEIKAGAVERIRCTITRSTRRGEERERREAI